MRKDTTTERYVEDEVDFSKSHSIQWTLRMKVIVGEIMMAWVRKEIDGDTHTHLKNAGTPVNVKWLQDDEDMWDRGRKAYII